MLEHLRKCWVLDHLDGPSPSVCRRLSVPAHLALRYVSLSASNQLRLSFIIPFCLLSFGLVLPSARLLNDRAAVRFRLLLVIVVVLVRGGIEQTHRPPDGAPALKLHSRLTHQRVTARGLPSEQTALRRFPASTRTIRTQHGWMRSFRIPFDWILWSRRASTCHGSLSL